MQGHKHLIPHIDNAFELLAAINDHIHVEVKKLYPQAELPKFQCNQISDKEITLIYQSSRPFASLAEGLIAGCGEYFNENLSIERRSSEEGLGFNATFLITKH